MHELRCLLHLFVRVDKRPFAKQLLGKFRLNLVRCLLPITVLSDPVTAVFDPITVLSDPITVLPRPTPFIPEYLPNLLSAHAIGITIFY